VCLRGTDAGSVSLYRIRPVSDQAGIGNPSASEQVNSLGSPCLGVLLVRGDEAFRSGVTGEYPATTRSPPSYEWRLTMLSSAQPDLDQQDPRSAVDARQQRYAEPGICRRWVVAGIGVLVLLGWLLVGVIAAAQRNYFDGSTTNCSKAGTTAVTIAAGPLNYLGANPKITCKGGAVAAYRSSPTMPAWSTAKHVGSV
jgi:hypothetical protein